MQIIPAAQTTIDKAAWNTNYSFVFVHGVAGWGCYDPQYRVLPYWGMFGGDLLSFLSKQGFFCYAASVDPNGSAWDRACELYAQLVGARVDYGKAHAKKHGHARFGKDYTGRALVPAFDATHKLNLIGHSFGGTTIRMLAHLLENGDADEVAAAGTDVSPLFTGGKGDWLHSLTTLATPHNGTTAYCDHTGNEHRMGPPLQRVMTAVMGALARKMPRDRGAGDVAEFDMYIDNALQLNEKLTVPEHLYCFSYPCCTTERQPDGKCTPIKSCTEQMFRATAEIIGAMYGVTRGGFVFDETWRDNDGLVNTVSARAPFDAPQQEFDPADIRRGVWNIMPVVQGDHMALEGGMFIVRGVQPLFLEQLHRINCLP